MKMTAKLKNSLGWVNPILLRVVGVMALALPLAVAGASLAEADTTINHSVTAEPSEPGGVMATEAGHCCLINLQRNSNK
ncbi:hypothetical protein [Desulfurivibrio sp. C05AmB]|uniref:hypothetical protein n=1 Tax=Desulfurivibrio sp. C05AmB TaxID=3374371 RepID=UPI00376EE8A3